MFKNLLKALDEISQTSRMEFKIDVDEKGFIDRECPESRCLFRFKVKPGTGPAKGLQMTCPMCGHQAANESWYTTTQIEKAKALAVDRLQGSINQAMRRDATDFNRNQPTNAFLKMSLRVSGGSSFDAIDIPIAAAEAMELEIECDACKTHYAVIGSAFFCPNCGHSSAERVFDDSIRKIMAKRDNISAVKLAIEASTGKDQAALVVRSLIESCLLDGVVAFQRFCEVAYLRLPNVGTPPFNAFQRLNDGSRLWRDAIGKGYEDWLDSTRLDATKLLFQRRHLLAHSDGIVDGKYINNTGDTTYRPGQRIVVTKDDIAALISSLSSLVAGIRALVPKPSD